MAVGTLVVGVVVAVGAMVGALEIVGWTESVGLSVGAAVGGQTNVSEPAPPEKSGIPSPVSSHDTSPGQESSDTAKVKHVSEGWQSSAVLLWPCSVTIVAVAMTSSVAVFIQVTTAPCHPSPHESAITSTWQSSMGEDGGAVEMAVGAGDGTADTVGFADKDGSGVGGGS